MEPRNILSNYLNQSFNVKKVDVIKIYYNNDNNNDSNNNDSNNNDNIDKYYIFTKEQNSIENFILIDQTINILNHYLTSLPLYYNDINYLYKDDWKLKKLFHDEIIIKKNINNDNYLDVKLYYITIKLSEISDLFDRLQAFNSNDENYIILFNYLYTKKYYSKIIKIINKIETFNGFFHNFINLIDSFFFEYNIILENFNKNSNNNEFNIYISNQNKFFDLNYEIEQTILNIELKKIFNCKLDKRFYIKSFQNINIKCDCENNIFIFIHLIDITYNEFIKYIYKNYILKHKCCDKLIKSFFENIIY
jgi:hypothetical protein